MMAPKSAWPHGRPLAARRLALILAASRALSLLRPRRLNMRLTAGQDADSGGDFLARHALATQALMRSITSCDRLAQQFGPRAAIVQGQA